MPNPPPEAELAALNREIERLEAELAMLEEQRAKRAKIARRAGWRARYLKLARMVRGPAASWPQWRLWALVVGPILLGVALFIVFDLVANSFSISLLGFLIGAGGGGGLLAALLFRPSDAILPAATDDAEAQARVTSAHWREAFERLTEVKDRLQRLVEERRAKMASGRVQRAALLQRPWKTMPSAEWEDFVVEVCRTIGANVERRGRGDEGAELVVDFGSRRVAMVAKQSRESINSGAVQQAIAVMKREHCDAAAIITAGRFTGAAQDFAMRNGCKLIGRDEFPDFVLGQVQW